ncbi:MAG: hypothetical protein R6X31_07665 [Anaerolineae bacterium]
MGDDVTGARVAVGLTMVYVGARLGVDVGVVAAVAVRLGSGEGVAVEGGV